jgi:hypothetical protein
MTEGALSGRVAMAKSDHFRQYAEEAMRSAHQSKSSKKKKLSSSLRAPGPHLLCRANGFYRQRQCA